MPVPPTYPGVYLEEVPGGVRPIPGVPTSITAFVGRALHGPIDTPIEIVSFDDYERIFGGLWHLSPMSFAVQQFYLNGGKRAVIVRVARGATSTRFIVPPQSGSDPLLLQASSPGAWANTLEIAIDYDGKDRLNDGGIEKPEVERVYFTITANETSTNDTEIIRNLIADVSLRSVLEQQSRFLRVQPDPSPGPSPIQKPASTSATPVTGSSGDDGNPIQDSDIASPGEASEKKGIYALEDHDLFNILVIPPLDFGSGPGHDVAASTWAEAADYCRKRRAFLIIDSPQRQITPPDISSALADFATLTASLPPASLSVQNAAYFFPRFRAINSLTDEEQDFAPSGAIAGIFARTDREVGVWKAPAGVGVGINGALGLTSTVSDLESDLLSQHGINCLRTFPHTGPVVWGSRTLQGADALSSDWKYIPVRRLALFIEESIYRGIQWAVFEPNDEPTWSQLRLSISAFMMSLFRQGAFQGGSPSEAYLVKCDSETTTQDDINRGIVNILVGFAPIKPAEFVIIRIQQLVGQEQS